MYKYEFTKAHVKWDDSIDLSTAHVEVIEQTPSKIHTKIQFSNGLLIDETLEIGKCVIESNCPIITDENHDLRFDFSKLEK